MYPGFTLTLVEARHARAFHGFSSFYIVFPWTSMDFRGKTMRTWRISKAKEEFNSPIDLDSDPIWTWSDGGLYEGAVRFVKEQISHLGAGNP